MSINEIQTEDYLKKASECLLIVENIIENFGNNFSGIIKENQELEDRLYCRKSTMLMGYFNPCPVEDLVIRNANRGKITSKNRIGKDVIIYYFNNDKISMCEDSFFTYLYFYKNNENNLQILGVPKRLSSGAFPQLLLCAYDDNNRIKKFTVFNAISVKKSMLAFSLFDSDCLLKSETTEQKYMFEFMEKEYIYSDNRLKEMKEVKLNSNSPKISNNKYKFAYEGDTYGLYTYNDLNNYVPLIKRKYNEFLCPPKYSDFV
ncbi:MAG: hypothetical protein IKJ59_00750 [Clostridia bacterium]|nr:hypothetical protein [Clostridia bacterium]